MKIDEDQAPRRDGFIEATGTWGEVTVGCLLAGSNRTDVWEVIDSKSPDQHEFAHTHWFKVVERKSGVVHAIKPKMINAKCKFLLADPTEKLPPRTPPSDFEEIALLAEALGATILWERDNATGEITCPMNEWARDGYLRHLKEAHDIDTRALEALTGDEYTAELHTIHGRAHDPRYPHVGKGGFSHRHVPEEHDII